MSIDVQFCLGSTPNWSGLLGSGVKRRSMVAWSMRKKWNIVNYMVQSWLLVWNSKVKIEIWNRDLQSRWHFLWRCQLLDSTRLLDFAAASLRLDQEIPKSLHDEIWSWRYLQPPLASRDGGITLIERHVWHVHNFRAARLKHKIQFLFLQIAWIAVCDSCQRLTQQCHVLQPFSSAFLLHYAKTDRRWALVQWCEDMWRRQRGSNFSKYINLYWSIRKGWVGMNGWEWCSTIFVTADSNFVWESGLEEGAVRRKVPQLARSHPGCNQHLQGRQNRKFEICQSASTVLYRFKSQDPLASCVFPIFTQNIKLWLDGLFPKWTWNHSPVYTLPDSSHLVQLISLLVSRCFLMFLSFLLSKSEGIFIAHLKLISPKAQT